LAAWLGWSAGYWAGQATPLVVPLWPEAVPQDAGGIGVERVRKPEEAPTRDAKWITNVTQPALSVFQPEKEKNTGAAVIVCPGGGYWNLAWDLEGEEVAAWLNRAGITGIVLKYRVPRRAGEPEALPAPGPLLDAQRAVRVARSRAKEWGIDPQRIGIMGFSAGGHLAVATATQFEGRGYERQDAMDEASGRPDFAAAIYPGYFLEQQPAGVEIHRERLAPYMKIGPGTPPIFLTHASDDTVAGAGNSAVLFLELRRAGIPAELHIYEQGGHGFGVRASGLPAAKWTERFVEWLAQRGTLVRQ